MAARQIDVELDRYAHKIMMSCAPSIKHGLISARDVQTLLEDCLLTFLRQCRGKRWVQARTRAMCFWISWRLQQFSVGVNARMGNSLHSLSAFVSEYMDVAT